MSEHVVLYNSLSQACVVGKVERLKSILVLRMVCAACKKSLTHALNQNPETIKFEDHNQETQRNNRISRLKMQLKRGWGVYFLLDGVRWGDSKSQPASPDGQPSGYLGCSVASTVRTLLLSLQKQSFDEFIVFQGKRRMLDPFCDFVGLTQFWQ